MVGTDTCRWYLKFSSRYVSVVLEVCLSEKFESLPAPVFIAHYYSSGASSICSHSDNFYLSIPVQLKTAIAKNTKNYCSNASSWLGQLVFGAG